MQMNDRDDAAAAYYEDPENRELRGSGQKRPRQPGRLTTHVPIRFSAGIIERVKDLAADDGKTVSSWIRDVVEREVLRRERSKTVGIMPTVQWKERPSEPSSSTLSSGEQSVEDLHRLVSLSWLLAGEVKRLLPVRAEFVYASSLRAGAGSVRRGLARARGVGRLLQFAVSSLAVQRRRGPA